MGGGDPDCSSPPSSAVCALCLPGAHWHGAALEGRGQRGVGRCHALGSLSTGELVAVEGGVGGRGVGLLEGARCGVVPCWAVEVGRRARRGERLGREGWWVRAPARGLGGSKVGELGGGGLGGAVSICFGKVNRPGRGPSTGG